MRQLTRLVVLAVALGASACGLIDAAGDADGTSDGSGGGGNGPHVVTFTPAIVVTDACGLGAELEVDALVADIDGDGDIRFEIDDASGSFIAAVFQGNLDGEAGSGDVDCDPADPDPPFVMWSVAGSPEDGFTGSYTHTLDGGGMISIVRQ